MGNSSLNPFKSSTQIPPRPFQSRSQDGEIFLRLDQPSFSSGDTLSGTVYLNLYNDICAGELTVKFNGQENALFAYETSYTVTKDVEKLVFDKTTKAYAKVTETEFIDKEGPPEFKREQKEFISLPFHLFSFDNLSAGTHNFPFSFLLPSNLRGSTYGIGVDFQAEIAYFLTVDLIQFLKPNDILQEKQRVRILDPRAKLIIPHRMEKFVRLKICGLFPKKGEVGVVVNLEKTVLFEGEQVAFSLSLDTKESSEDLTGVTISLIERLSMKWGWNKFSARKSEVLFSGEGLRKGEVKQISGSLQVAKCQEGKIQNKMLDKKKKSFIAYNLRGQCNKKGEFMASTKGEFFEVSHEILVSCKTERLLTCNLEMRIPVVVQKKGKNLDEPVPFETREAQVRDMFNLVANRQRENEASGWRVDGSEDESMVDESEQREIRYRTVLFD